MHDNTETSLWSREKPKEPGFYWFAWTKEHYESAKDNYSKQMFSNIELREVSCDKKGVCFVSNIDKGDWGPDARYLAMNNKGYWQRIVQPERPWLINA